MQLLKHADLHVSQVWCVHTFRLIGKVFFCGIFCSHPSQKITSCPSTDTEGAPMLHQTHSVPHAMESI